MKIDLLKNHQQHIPILASWFKEASPDYFKDKSPDAIADEQFASRLNDNILPISFLAYEDEIPIGTVALLLESITTHKHLSPWLSGLHVHPEYRHKGIGLKLVQTVLEKATTLGFDSIYIGISKAEEHYIAQGWEVFEKVIFYGKPLTILRRNLIISEV
ncbi:MAG: GNAT family N-acetyltransferase [Pyrinomonadaceae bacterium]